MWILKKILNIDNQRTCFCGRSLIKNYCEVHGIDIKISNYIINAQFEQLDEIYKKIKSINISLTENQFINLFLKKDLENLLIDKEEYIISILQFDSINNIKSIVNYFFEQIESDNFFNSYRFRETQITKSNIFLNFLYNYEIIELKKIKLQFNIIAVRKLSDYINWRLKHFQAKPENIYNSLLGERNMVYMDNGELCKITSINCLPIDNIPNNFTIQKQNTLEMIEEIKPKNLYHSFENLMLNNQLENRIHSALRSFSQQFLKSFKHYLIKHSCSITFEKINQTKLSLYNKLIGKNIKKEINLAYFHNE